MTLTALNGLVIPPYPDINNVAPGTNNQVIDATGEKSGFVVQAPKTGNIRKIHFRTAAAATPTDTDVRVESVDAATGMPSGSLLNANSNVTVASASITANSWITTGNLTADAAVTKGQLIAIVVAPTGSPNIRVAVFSTNAGFRFPYVTLFTAAWALVPGNVPILALEYSDGSFAYMPGVNAASAFNSHAIASDTTPDEIALVFQVPGPVTVSGFWLWADLDGDADVILYNSDGSSALVTLSIDKDVRAATTVGMPFIFTFATPVDLSGATTYMLAVKPTTTTALTIYSFDVASAAILDQHAGGQAFHYRQATDGAWAAATTTRRPYFGLFLSAIDNGAGSGSAPKRIFG